MIRKKYYLDIEKDIIKYGDEGFKYKPKLPSKITHKINHKINHKKNEIKEEAKITNNNIYVEPFKSKDKHHLKDHFKKIVETLTDDEEQQEKAMTGLNAIYYNGLSDITHDDISIAEREYAVLNEASMKYAHGSNQQEINDYLKQNNVTDYKIDFENSTNDALVAINKKNNKATIAFRGSSMTSRAKNDWSSNGEILKNINLNTDSHKKIDEFYNDINELYDIEHIAGYSRGGHWTEFLANKYDKPATIFNGFVSPSNLKNAKTGKKIITHISTTEDIVSPLRNILALNKKNVKIKTINPTSDNSQLTNLIAGHNNNNFTNTEALSRAGGRKKLLREQIINTGQKMGELDMVEKAKIIKDNGGNMTDFLRRITPNDVIEERSLIDNSKTFKYSPRIKGGGVEARIWNEVGGEMTSLEQLLLSQNPNTEEVIFESSRLERNNHAYQPQHIRRKNMNFLENDIKENARKYDSSDSGKDDVSSRRNYGLTPKNVGSLISAPLFGQSVSRYGGESAGDFTTGFIASQGGFKGRLSGGGAMLVTGRLADSITSNIQDQTTKNVVNSAVAMGGIPIVEGLAMGAGSVLGVAEAPVVAGVLATAGILAGVGAGLGYALPFLKPILDPVTKPVSQAIDFAVDNTIGKIF